MPETPDELLNPEQEIEDIARLAALYTAGVLAIKAAQDKINPLNPDRLAYLREVESITRKLETETVKWVEEAVPKMYTDASVTARQYMKKNLQPTLSAIVEFSDIDRLAVDVIAGNTTELYSNALASTRRRASSMIDSILQEKITAELSKATQRPITPKELQVIVKDIIDEAGVGSLVDRGGKTWQLDTYANMVARTEFTHITNEATKNQALREGYDLVRFSVHGATDSCALWEGRVVSLTGKTPGFPSINAIAGTHMLGPNCKHTYTPISVSEI